MKRITQTPIDLMQNCAYSSPRGSRWQSLFLSGAVLSLMASVALLPLMFNSVAQAQESSVTRSRTGEVVVEFNRLDGGDLLVKGFRLTSETRLYLSAIGAAPKHSTELSAYCWILDAKTREPVWVMDRRDSDRLRRTSSLYETEDEIVLPAGHYEAIYFVGKPYRWGNVNLNFDSEDFENLMEALAEELENLGEELEDELDDLFDDDRERDRERDRRRERREREREREERWEEIGREWEERGKNFKIDHGLTDRELSKLEFTVKARRASFESYSPSVDAPAEMVIDFRKVGDDERLRKGFTLARETKLIISALGEYSESGNIFVDQGWIVDANTRERVWEMDKWSTRFAGGGRKNRYVRDKITLPAGDYLAHFMSDDSHSFDLWNAAPPYDPFNYGMTVSVATSSERSQVTSYTYDAQETTLFALDRVRNNSFESQGFTLKQETPLRIYCLGEFAFNEFADYGWIENTETMETVWEMDEDNTTHAGGGTKNRVFDDVITLPAGDYMAHFTTDDSHAYRSWNTARPFEPEKWGLTIYGTGKKFDKSTVKLFKDAPKSENMIASLTRVGDDEEVYERFTITEPTTIRILALGEGSGGRMHDYGWIEEVKTGRKVWKMRYRGTRHAGGASKNRLVRITLDLEPGEYEVVFVTDGSHSFGDFNATPPRSPQQWGIAISKK